MRLIAICMLSLPISWVAHAQAPPVPDWLPPVAARIAALQASHDPGERWQGAELSLALGVAADGGHLAAASALEPVFLGAWQADPAVRLHRHRLLRLCQGTLDCGGSPGRNLGPAAGMPSPGLLPARSWQKMMQGLDKHFGQNAELDAPTAADIGQFLQATAADSKGRYRVSQPGRAHLRQLLGPAIPD